MDSKSIYLQSKEIEEKAIKFIKLKYINKHYGFFNIDGFSEDGLIISLKDRDNETRHCLVKWKELD